METVSALLAIYAGNSPVPGEFPAQRPVTRSFDVFFDLHPNKRLSKQWWGWWFETPSCPLWRHRNVIHVFCHVCLWIRICKHLNQAITCTCSSSDSADNTYLRSVVSPHKRSAIRKEPPCHDVIMNWLNSLPVDPERGQAPIYSLKATAFLITDRVRSPGKCAISPCAF